MRDALAYRAAPIERVRVPERALDLIEKWAIAKPHAWALLEKESAWHAYTWRSVARRVADLRGALAQKGIADGARFAISGQLDAQLILVAIAAQANGATIIPIDRHSDAASLGELLQGTRITHAYVPDRKALSTWLAIPHGLRSPVSLFSAPDLHASSNVSPVPHNSAAPTTTTKQSQPAQRKAPTLQRRSALWVDEGTEWTEGLTEVIGAWLESGSTLGAPETSASASRDRFELQPHRIIASNARRRRMQAELNARLYPPGTWLRTLADVGLRSSTNPLTAWIGKRIARLNGLPAEAIQAPIAPQSAPHNVGPSIVGDAT